MFGGWVVRKSKKIKMTSISAKGLRGDNLIHTSEKKSVDIRNARQRRKYQNLFLKMLSFVSEIWTYLCSLNSLFFNFNKEEKSSKCNFLL